MHSVDEEHRPFNVLLERVHCKERMEENIGQALVCNVRNIYYKYFVYVLVLIIVSGE